jgi:hypothetical protein
MKPTTRIHKWMLLLLFTASISTQAQVSIQFTNSGYLMSKDQLWNMMLVNTGTSRTPVRIEITLLDVVTNQPLCKLTGRNTTLAEGPKLMSIQDALPVQTINYSPGFTDPNPYGILPAGKYMMCIDLLFFDGELWQNLGNDCNEIEVVAFSPVILTLPEDMAVLETTNPILTWLSPMPVAQFSQLQYDLLLVPVTQNQTPQDAIERNIPMLNVANIPATNYSYLSSFPALQPGKVYSWRVTAKNNGSVVSVSETWSFTVQDTNAVPTYIKPINYTPLKKGDNNNFVTTTSEIGFEYLNSINEDSVTVQIIDVTTASAAQRVKATLRLRVTYGQNFMALNTREDYGLETGKSYKIVLTNLLKEEWVMSFYLK